MVFENLTLFEIRIDDSQFGPRSLGQGDDADEGIEVGMAGGRTRLAAVAAVLFITVGAAALWRRSRSDDDDEFAAMDEPASEADAGIATAD